MGMTTEKPSDVQRVVNSLIAVFRDGAELTENRLDAIEILVEQFRIWVERADTTALVDIACNGAESGACRVRAARQALWLLTGKS